MLDLKGKTVQSCEYFELELIGDHILAGSYQDTSVTYGILDSQFEVLVPISYKTINEVQGHFIAKDAENLLQVFNRKGILVTDIKFDAYWIVGGYLEFSRKGAKGLIDLAESTLVHAAIYKSFSYTADGPQPVLPKLWSIRERDLSIKVQVHADSVVANGDLLIGFLNGQQRVFKDSIEILPNKHFDVKQSEGDFIVIHEKTSGYWHALIRGAIIASGDSIFFDGAYFLVRSES